MNFKQLSELLRKTSDNLFQQAIKAVNINLTLRNWLFGHYIVEYEQNGEDKARYGKSQKTDNVNSNVNITSLIGQTLSDNFQKENCIDRLKP